ncbi:hypothetical protein Hamer_G017353, partial [Homarus americanus]
MRSGRRSKSEGGHEERPPRNNRRSSLRHRPRHVPYALCGDGSASTALKLSHPTRVRNDIFCGPATRRTPAEDAARTAGVTVAAERGDTSRRRIVQSARESVLDEDTARLARKMLRNTGRIHRRMQEDTRQRRRRRASMWHRDVPGQFDRFKDDSTCKMNARVVCND